MPTSLQLAQWLRNEIDRSQKNALDATNEVDVEYYGGMFDAFHLVLAKLEGQVN